MQVERMQAQLAQVCYFVVMKQDMLHPFYTERALNSEQVRSGPD